MNTQNLLEHKPNFELEAMLEQISKSRSEIMPLKLVDYYPTSFLVKPIEYSEEKVKSFLEKLGDIGYTVKNPHNGSETK